MPDAPNPNPSAPTGDQPADSTLAAKLDALTQQLTHAHAALGRLEQARRVDQLVLAARASDPAAVAEMVEHTLAESNGKLTPEAALEQVRRRRPGAFRASPASTPGSAMSPRIESPPPATPDPARLAERVAAGDHRAILAFMRARRGS